MALESLGKEPRRRGGRRQSSSSSGETLLEKEEKIQGLVQEFRLASSMSRVKSTPAHTHTHTSWGKT